MLGCFGLAMGVKWALRLEKSTQTKENLMGRLDLADIYVYENEGHRVQDKMNFGVFVGFNSLGNSGFFVLLS